MAGRNKDCAHIVGELETADIFTNEVLFAIWEDMNANVPQEHTAKRLDIHRNSVRRYREKIQFAVRNDPDFKKKCRAKMDEKFALVSRAIDNNLLNNNPTVALGVAKGIGALIDDHDSAPVTDSQDTQSLVNRLLDIIAGVRATKP